MTSDKIAKLRALVADLTPDGKHMQVEAIRLIADILADLNAAKTKGGRR
jgi:hypothetical protein